jgi:hypothetical protein
MEPMLQLSESFDAQSTMISIDIVFELSRAGTGPRLVMDFIVMCRPLFGRVSLIRTLPQT